LAASRRLVAPAEISLIWFSDVPNFIKTILNNCYH
jgi:hypothetical protein